MKSSPKTLFAVLALAILVSGCGKEPDLPNIVLITTDTVRADYLGCYGAKWETPAIDALAASGVRFEWATCQIPATLTSHTAILSSLYPRKSGVRFSSFLVPDKVETLAETLKREGYQTAAFVSAYVLDGKYGLDQGFDVYDDGPLHPVERPASEVNEKAFEWLESGRDNKRPFFLWVHYYDAHSPYEPPKEWLDRYDPDYDGKFTGSGIEVTRLIATRGKIAAPRDLEHLRARYAAEISALDEEIANLLDRVRAEEEETPTLTALLSDHGEALGEHGKFFHGEDLYEQSTRIPFIISYPGVVTEDLVIDDLVHSLDLMPTVLSLAGLEGPGEMQGDDLSDWLTQEGSTEPRNLVSFLETEEEFLSEGDKILGARTQRHKFVQNTAQRRPPSFYGRVVNERLDRPMFAQAYIKGTTYARVGAHIRYHTAETAPLGNRAPNLSSLPTTYIASSVFGSDPLHNEALAGNVLGKPNAGWRAVVTANLFERALEYGVDMGFPIDHMLVESLMVDLSAPWTVDSVKVQVDNLELVIRNGDGPPPSWDRRIIADLESGKADHALKASDAGPDRETKYDWAKDSAFPGELSQGIAVRFKKDSEETAVDELYDLDSDPGEIKNLVERGEAEKTSEDLARKIAEWVVSTSGETAETAVLSKEERARLKALGYIQ